MSTISSRPEVSIRRPEPGGPRIRSFSCPPRPSGRSFGPNSATPCTRRIQPSSPRSRRRPGAKSESSARQVDRRWTHGPDISRALRRPRRPLEPTTGDTRRGTGHVPLQAPHKALDHHDARRDELHAAVFAARPAQRLSKNPVPPASCPPTPARRS